MKKYICCFLVMVLIVPQLSFAQVTTHTQPTGPEIISQLLEKVETLRAQVIAQLLLKIEELRKQLDALVAKQTEQETKPKKPIETTPTTPEEKPEELIEKTTNSFTIGAGDHDFTLTHGGVTRKYRVHVPASYNKNRATPAVIYLHGGGGSIQAAYDDGVDKYSDKHGFILIVPAGTGVLPNRLLVWNAGKWPEGECCGYALKNNIDDVGFISKMIDETARNFHIDKARVYSAGISNGGIMSYRLACELSNKIAAVAAVAAPAIPENCTPEKPIPVMSIHGTADPCALFSGGPNGACIASANVFTTQPATAIVAQWGTINSCSNEAATASYQKGAVTCTIKQQCKDGANVEFCVVTGGGHTWPSGSQYLPERRIGAVSNDISFDQIWDFFNTKG